MDPQPSILIVDDDDDIRTLLSDYLSEHGFRTTVAGDGKQMWTALDAHRLDLVVLDIMLPGESGLALCRTLRSRSSTPVIILTALGDETERIVGLEMGADDYVAKPFSPRELLARIRSVLRRVNALPEKLSPENASKICFAGWTLNTRERHALSPHKVVVPLGGMEFRLLRVLLTYPHRVLSRDALLDLVQGREAGPFDRSIDVQISRLRQRLEEDARQPTIIKTVRSEGYVLATDVEMHA
jgi:two-component system OmpR family response regulator